MNFLILFALLTLQLHLIVPPTSALNEKRATKCPYENTVNLTNQQRFKNGSYLYEGIIIPPDKQQFYDYHMNLLGEKESAPLHLRGCVCEERPCLKWCCQKDEYLHYNKNMRECKQFINVSWILPIQLQIGQSTKRNLFTHFATVTVPCEQPKDLVAMDDEWILKENGSLIVNDKNIKSFCFSPRLDRTSGKYFLSPFKCTSKRWRILLFKYSQHVLLLFLIFTVMMYLVLHELRRNLGEKIFFCYLISATICQAILNILNLNPQLLQDRNSCISLGFIGYFFYIASFSWLSVLCYDIWKNFTEINFEPNPTKTLMQILIYSRFAWLSAGLATFVFAYVELSEDVKPIFKPGLRIGRCWINPSKWSSMIYFLGPALIVLLLNIITFIRLVAIIYKVRRDVASLTHNKKFVQKYTTVIIRLFLMLGVPWFLHFLPFYIPGNRKFNFLYVLSNCFDGIQGILIFALFVLRRKVWYLLKERFDNREIHWPHIFCNHSAT